MNTKTYRDYVGEMRKIVDRETASGPYVPRVVAAKIVAQLREQDPELLDGWLHQQAEQFVYEMIAKRDRSLRAYIKRRANSAAFARDAARGDLTGWLTTRFAVEGGEHKQLRDMRRREVMYVAYGYENRANDNKMMAVFLKTIANQLNSTETVGDRYTEEQLGRMWHSLKNL